MALHLGQVEVRPGTLRHERFGVVEEVESEIHQGAGDLVAVDKQMSFDKVPAAGTHQQHGGFRAERVLFAFGTGVADVAADGIAEIDLAGEIVLPGGGVGVFEIGHEDVGAGIEGVDDHLAVDGAGDLDAAVHQIARDGSGFPVGFADGFGFGEKGRELAGVDGFLAHDAFFEKFAAPGVEAVVQFDEEGDGLRREDFFKGRGERSFNGHAGELRSGHRHYLTAWRSGPATRSPALPVQGAEFFGAFFAGGA